MRSRGKGRGIVQAVECDAEPCDPVVVNRQSLRLTRWIREGKEGPYRIAVDMKIALTVCDASERLNGALYSAEYHRNVKRDDSRYALPGPVVLPIDQETERVLGIIAASTAEAERVAQDAERRALGLALLDYWLNGADSLCEEYDAWSEGGAPWWAPLEAEAV